MKANATNTLIQTEDEFSSFYNWSERTAVFFRSNKKQVRFTLVDGVIDLICMTATTIAMISCI